MKDLYYEVQHSGIKTHFGTLGAAKRVAQKWANETGLMLRIFKASHKEYHRTGSSYRGEVAQVYPKTKNPACQGSGWKMNPRQALAFPSKAAAQKYAREHGLTGYRIKKNPATGAGRGGRASGAGAGGAGGGAGAGSQGGASRTEVRSPTRTSTATHAKTWGNITVTGGAGRGATTTVKIAGPGKKKNPLPMGRMVKVKAKRLKNGRIELYRA